MSRFIDYETTTDGGTGGDSGTATETPSITADELRSIIGEEIDTRLSAMGLQDRLSKLDLLDDLDGLFERHKSAPMDQKSLVAEINRAIDSKLAGLTNGTGTESGSKRQGPLSRWLGI